MEAGSFGIRLGARILDNVALTLVAMVCGFVSAIFCAFLALAGIIGEGWEQRIGHTSAATIAVSYVSHLAYSTLSEGLGGTSLGKLICGLRVVRVDGQPPTLLKALGRNLAFYIDSLFFGAIGWSSMSGSPLRQRYGDKWTDTAVIYARSLGPTSKRNPAVGLVLGFAVVIVSNIVSAVLRAI